jgi:glycosyltransferase involved in cell wall biosynthesis
LNHYNGTPLIASDIPVFKELVGNDADFFTLGDITSFNNAVENLQKNYTATKIRLEKYKWLTWEDATEQLLYNVEKMALRIRQDYK